MEREEKKCGVEESVLETGLVAHAAVLHNETDLVDHHPSEALNETEHTIDYHDLSKAELLKLVKKLAAEADAVKAERELREIKSAYEELFEEERSRAFNRFILEGGKPDEFNYRGDEWDGQFQQYFKIIRDRKALQIKQEESRKNDNYQKKLELLERLRQLVDSPDVNTNQFEQFKALQAEWKSIGAVPGVHSKTLWANYHALVDRFYDNQSIYFELKELDRKKNLEAKIELCERAERLAQVENIQQALRELNELHHEFKHIGPVPREEKEAIWARFKAASDAVYARRDAFNRELQEKLQASLRLKTELSERVQEFASFQSDRIKEWNQKATSILELQKQWEQAGPMPRSKGKEVSKKFWSAFKTFFQNKNAFFKKIEAERKENLKKKQELVAKAKELQNSDDWENTANELRKLQVQWKEIGAVPDKYREKIFKEFKEACDHFFERYRSQRSQEESKLQENLRVKQEICAKMEEHAASRTASLEEFHALVGKFRDTGAVPRAQMAEIRERYHKALEHYLRAIPDLPADEVNRLIIENQILDLKADPEASRKLQQKEQAIRKKILKVEHDIGLLKNNVEFFSRSKNAESLREEVNRKIEEATERLNQLKQQLKILRSVS
jgi:hypothetical protein